MYDAYNLILKLLIILLLRVAHDLYITRFQWSSFAHALSAFERWIEARTTCIYYLRDQQVSHTV